ncbi:MAG: cation:dicarboxylase symporter family transporter, partial [Alistipes sp.]|nr:cation:dicarboxylase symporter family transporter [Candidatus Minthomonas equi]
MRKIKIPLLGKVLIAIGLGIGCSYFFPLPIIRIFVTFSDLFGEFLSFVVPVLILALVAPGIADLGQKAGKLLGITALLAYVFTVFSGFLGYFSGRLIFPSLMMDAGNMSAAMDNSNDILSYFHIEMPPLMDVMSALIISFILGIGLSKIKGGLFVGILKELQDVIMLVIEKVLIPLIPFFIFSIFLKMGAEGQLGSILGQFVLIILVIFLMSVLLLLIQFSIAFAVTGKNPFKALKVMLPAYVTALGTQSSAATIPVTLAQTKKNGVSDEVADFVIPLCATIHLSGSCLKIAMCTLAICLFSGIPCG